MTITYAVMIVASGLIGTNQISLPMILRTYYTERVMMEDGFKAFNQKTLQRSFRA